MKGNTPTSFTFSAWPYDPVLRTVELLDRSLKFLQILRLRLHHLQIKHVRRHKHSKHL